AQVIARAGGTAAPAQQQPQAPAQNNPPSNNDGNVGAIAVSADDDPAVGPADAKVTVIEFSDFQCPFCGRFYTQTLPQIKQNYVDTGKIRFVYRDFPLESIHPNARPAANAAECADEQGKFWEYHNKLFENQGSLSDAYYKQAASELGLDMEQFNSCYDSKKYDAEVSKDFQDGASAGVTGTPTVFVNGRAIVGAQPYATFQAAIDQALAA
ncbi:MAG: DsbA family protein, partial [Candidatus Aenigmarchaeota archaeon]|nr:DsbA family protein [Candidatus Aenigmarchaeota archaeon]